MDVFARAALGDGRQVWQSCRVRFRSDVDQLRAEEWARFVRAVHVLGTRDSVLRPGEQSRYADFVEVHRAEARACRGPDGIGWARGGSAFLPWHRTLLFEFESALREHEPEVTVPYWDWTRLRDREAISARLEPLDELPIAWLPVEGNQREARTWGSTRARLPQLDRGEGSVRSVLNAASYLELRPALEAMHGTVRAWVGGAMAGPLGPSDPLYWLELAGLDRLWSIWARRHPSRPKYQHGDGIEGHRSTDPLMFYTDKMAPPWSRETRPIDVLDVKALGGEGVWYASEPPEVDTGRTATHHLGEVASGIRVRRGIALRIRTSRTVALRIRFGERCPFETDQGAPEVLIEGVATRAWRSVVVPVWCEPRQPGVHRARGELEVCIVDEAGWYGEASRRSVVQTLPIEVAIRGREPAGSTAVVLDCSEPSLAWHSERTRAERRLQATVGTVAALSEPTERVAVVTYDRAAQTVIERRAADELSGQWPDDGWKPEGEGRGMLDALALAGAELEPGRARRLLLLASRVDPGLVLPEVTTRAAVVTAEAPTSSTPAVWGGRVIVPRASDETPRSFAFARAVVDAVRLLRDLPCAGSLEGSLGWNSMHRVELSVCAVDRALRLVVACPVPELLSLALVAPSGRRYDPEHAEGFSPTVRRWPLGLEVRVPLPLVEVQSHETGPGRWTVEVQLRSVDEVRELLASHRIEMDELGEARQSGALPYAMALELESDRLVEPWCEAIVTGRPFELGIARLDPRIGIDRGSLRAWLVRGAGAVREPLDIEWSSESSLRGRASTSEAGPALLEMRVEGATPEGHRFIRQPRLPVLIESDRAPRRELPVDAPRGLRRGSAWESWVQTFGASLFSADPTVLFDDVGEG